MYIIKSNCFEEGVYVCNTEDDLYLWLDSYCQKEIDLGIKPHDVESRICNSDELEFYKVGEFNKKDRVFNCSDFSISRSRLADEILHIE